jgi:hypothetical protein
VLAWARRLGVIPEASVPSDASAVFAARARQRAIGALDQRKLRQALAWAEDFVAETNGRAFFVSLDGPADGAGSAYNWASLDGFAEYVRAAGSRVRRKEGKKLSGDYIQSLAGALRILREEAIGASVVLPRPSTSRTFKAMRKEDGPPGSRDSRRALRAHHLRALVEKGWHLEHPDAWEVALVAHNLLLRGGEVGCVEGRDASGRPIEFDERRGLTWGSVEWRQPSVASGWRAWAVGWVCAIKDQSNTNKRQPIVIAQRVARGSLDDPMCAYAALARRWRRLVGAIPSGVAAGPATRGKVGRLAATHAMARQPVFANKVGKASCTRATSRRLRRTWRASSARRPSTSAANRSAWAERQTCVRCWVWPRARP